MSGVMLTVSFVVQILASPLENARHLQGKCRVDFRYGIQIGPKRSQVIPGASGKTDHYESPLTCILPGIVGQGVTPNNRLSGPKFA